MINVLIKIVHHLIFQKEYFKYDYARTNSLEMYFNYDCVPPNSSEVF